MSLDSIIRLQCKNKLWYFRSHRTTTSIAFARQVEDSELEHVWVGEINDRKRELLEFQTAKQESLAEEGKRGNAEALFALGLLLADSLRKIKAAIKAFKKAAELGHAQAMSRLAVATYHENHEEAMIWYRSSGLGDSAWGTETMGWRSLVTVILPTVKSF